MKKSVPYLYFFALLLCIPSSQLIAQSRNDTLQIKATVLDYLEGLDTNNPERVDRAMHPDLAKRIVEKNKEGNDIAADMTAASLIGYTKDFDFTLFYMADVVPEVPLRVDTTIYDIVDGIATVKAETNRFEFVDYIHLAKFDGRWKIINILWAWTGNTNAWMNKP